MIWASKCRPLNSAGRFLRIIAAYQTGSFRLATLHSTHHNRATPCNFPLTFQKLDPNAIGAASAANASAFVLMALKPPISTADA